MHRSAHISSIVQLTRAAFATLLGFPLALWMLAVDTTARFRNFLSFAGYCFSWPWPLRRCSAVPAPGGLFRRSPAAYPA